MSQPALHETIASAIDAHYGHDDGLTVDIGELSTTLIGALAFHVALLPQMDDRRQRRLFADECAVMLRAMIKEARADLVASGIAQAATATPYDPARPQ
jgi:hypothetical protein